VEFPHDSSEEEVRDSLGKIWEAYGSPGAVNAANWERDKPKPPKPTPTSPKSLNRHGTFQPGAFKDATAGCGAASPTSPEEQSLRERNAKKRKERRAGEDEAYVQGLVAAERAAALRTAEEAAYAQEAAHEKLGLVLGLETWHGLEGHRKEITCLAVCEGSDLVATGSRDETGPEHPVVYPTFMPP